MTQCLKFDQILRDRFFFSQYHQILSKNYVLSLYSENIRQIQFFDPNAFSLTIFLLHISFEQELQSNPAVGFILFTS